MWLTAAHVNLASEEVCKDGGSVNIRPNSAMKKAFALNFFNIALEGFSHAEIAI